MASDNSQLLTGKVPAFAREIKNKHNALVRLIKSMEGKSSAKVTVTDGKIIVETDLNAIIAAVVASSAFTDAVTDLANTIATDRANDRVAAIPRQSIDVCGLGTVSFLTD